MEILVARPHSVPHGIVLKQSTDHGQASLYAAISADGHTLAYVKREGNRSLRVKQIATGSEVTVVPAGSKKRYSGYSRVPSLPGAPEVVP
jgi:Tol biopolymer transport system component